MVDTEQAAERLNDVEHIEIAGGIIEEEVPVIHVIKAVIVRIGGPRFKAGDVGLEPVDVVTQNKAQDKPQSEHGAEDGHGGRPKTVASFIRARRTGRPPFPARHESRATALPQGTGRRAEFVSSWFLFLSQNLFGYGLDPHLFFM